MNTGGTIMAGRGRFVFWAVLLAALALCAPEGRAQTNSTDPRIGYLYPAGGRQGSVFQVVAGGQRLTGVTGALVTGEGVTASVVQYYRPLRNLKKEQRDELMGRFKEAWARQKQANVLSAQPPLVRDDTGVLAVHPLLRGLDAMGLRELAHAKSFFMNFQKRQINPQIGESVVLEVQVDPWAGPGDRELRLVTKTGVSNPLRFQVGLPPEVCELEPNESGAVSELPEPEALETPVLLNGQIMPGDVDRFRIRAQKGQRLVVDAGARRLIPYLADAVPGWFQAVVTLRDAAGVEVARVDDFRFDPDPVLFCEIPADGVYILEIHDSVYRGREDFVYRMAVGELPFITRITPLGGREGKPVEAVLDGWNLPARKVELDMRPGGGARRHASVELEGIPSNAVPYAVDTLPEGGEAEPNDSINESRRIAMPRVINGRIEKPGDADVFRIDGRAGETVVAEVWARRLNSPLDPLLRLMDDGGNVVAWNDDHDDPGAGLITHQADARVAARLEKDGVYYLQISDAQNAGGKEYGYRLRVTPPQPGFSLRVTPSSVNLASGRSAPVTVHAVRSDGFEGPIEVVLAEGAGLSLQGGVVPPGVDAIRMTITAPAGTRAGVKALRLEGRAQIGGETVARPVIPCEDMMQAFLYRHLVPVEELLAAVRQGTGAPAVEIDGGDILRIPKEGTAQVRVKLPKNPKASQIRWALSGAPEGFSLEKEETVPGGFILTLKTAGEKTPPGFRTNLIMEGYAEQEQAKGEKGPKKQPQRVFLGCLPAIPVEVMP